MAGDVPSTSEGWSLGALGGPWRFATGTMTPRPGTGGSTGPHGTPPYSTGPRTIPPPSPTGPNAVPGATRPEQATARPGANSTGPQQFSPGPPPGRHGAIAGNASAPAAGASPARSGLSRQRLWLIIGGVALAVAIAVTAIVLITREQSSSPSIPGAFRGPSASDGYADVRDPAPRTFPRDWQPPGQVLLGAAA